MDMVRVIVVVTALASAALGGYITHHENLIDHENHGKATSFQSIHIEHFHPVPAFYKKEHQHLLEHPVPIGNSISNVKIHHGDKHDPGFAIITTSNDLHGEEHKNNHEGIFVGGGHAEVGASHENVGFHGDEHGDLSLAQGEISHETGYQVQDSGHDFAPYHSHISQGSEEDPHQTQVQFSGHDYSDALNHYHLAAAAVGDSHLVGNHQAYSLPAASISLSHYGKS